MKDPRRLLQEAAELRIACEILQRSGQWSHGLILRVEKGGIVVLAPGTKLGGGEEVRCWFVLHGNTYTFEASTIRAGVPVPDRSQDGYLLGFLDNFKMGEPRGQASTGPELLVMPPRGAGVSITGDPGRLVELTTDTLTFMLPADHTLVFVKGGAVRLHFHVPGVPQHEVDARIVDMVPGESHLLYSVKIEAIDDAEAHRRILSVFEQHMD